MRVRQIRWLMAVAYTLLSGAAMAGQGGFKYDEACIPRFNVPQTTQPPTIDGVMHDDEWRQSALVTGMVVTSSLHYRDRPVFFRLAWDAQHLYIGARSDILPGHRMYRSKRERWDTGVVFDDAYEFGLFLHDRNKKPSEASFFMKMVINSLGAGEYMKIYPSIGQNMYNWQPETDIANTIYEKDGTQWWDMEMAMDLADLELPTQLKAGMPLDVLLTADLKNPGWQWLDFPSATGHLQHYGFPRTILTSDQPYVQVEEMAGLHDEKLKLRAAIYNPSDKPVEVRARLGITYHPPPKSDTQPQTVLDEQQALTIPAHGVARFDLDKTFPGLIYAFQPWGAPLNASRLAFTVTPAAAGQPPIYTYYCDFSGTNKDYLKAEPRTTVFEYAMEFNPVSHTMLIAGDTLDAQLPAGSTIAALEYRVDGHGKTVAQGRITQFVQFKYEDLITLPALAPGTYRVTLTFVDAAGTPLVSRNDITFQKKDEAQEFAAWWNNTLGNPERLLQPFEALRAIPAVGGTILTCTRRAYRVDGLGLPRQIVANGGNLLTRPARIVVTVGGREYAVPAPGHLTVTAEQDWRITFAGQAEAAGLRFSVTGWLEQDGLVNLDLTYAPLAQPVAIEGLRVEWPVEGADGTWMSCIGGVGGNYAPRTIGKVPDGQGMVWNTLDGIGKAGSTMRLGNFESNLWIGNERRGLCWFADSDRGWVPHDRTPAHSLVRTGTEVAIWNNLINLPPGEHPFVLDAPRTVQLMYNATPFRHFARGWRLTQPSAANGFSGPTYKYDEDEKKEYFSLLSMPSSDVARWPYYFAKYRQEAERASKDGYYGPGPRLKLFTTNQIALRGYMDKTREPGLYEYFRADWVPGNESLNTSYQDYMLYLMDRHIREGGVTHYYFDISFTRDAEALAAGLGYRLPDGRVQPTSMDAALRAWYRRTWALMQEHHLYPGGVSGHATNSIALRALPFADAILDSEYPMTDPIDTYPADRMIAMSHPETFGVNIVHLGFMNPEWAGMHDAGMGGGGASFTTADFRHFGITADDVTFIPYWRNRHVVTRIAPGLLASIWQRPRGAILAIMNYGPDPAAAPRTRACDLTLDLRALGLPAGVAGERLRVRDLYQTPRAIDERYYKTLPWFTARAPEAVPASWPGHRAPLNHVVAPQLDLKTGRLTGFDIEYHNVRYVYINWDAAEIRDAAWGARIAAADRRSALEWGINTATELPKDVVANAVRVDAGGVQVDVWQQPCTALLRLANPSARAVDATLTVDLAALGVRPALWKSYVQCLGGTLDVAAGTVTVKAVPAHGSRLVYLDLN